MRRGLWAELNLSAEACRPPEDVLDLAEFCPVGRAVASRTGQGDRSTAWTIRSRPVTPSGVEKFLDYEQVAAVNAGPTRPEPAGEQLCMQLSDRGWPR